MGGAKRRAQPSLAENFKQQSSSSTSRVQEAELLHCLWPIIPSGGQQIYQWPGSHWWIYFYLLYLQTHSSTPNITAMNEYSAELNILLGFWAVNQESGDWRNWRMLLLLSVVCCNCIVKCINSRWKNVTGNLQIRRLQMKKSIIYNFPIFLYIKFRFACVKCSLFHSVKFDLFHLLVTAKLVWVCLNSFTIIHGCTVIPSVNLNVGLQLFEILNHNKFGFDTPGLDKRRLIQTS